MSGKNAVFLILVLVIVASLVTTCDLPGNAPVTTPAPTPIPTKKMPKIELRKVGDSDEIVGITVTLEGVAPDPDCDDRYRDCEKEFTFHAEGYAGYDIGIMETDLRNGKEINLSHDPPTLFFKFDGEATTISPK